MIGYYVLCYQDISGTGAVPFQGKIEVDNGTYWTVSYKGKRHRVHKGSCSTVPFKNAEHARSDEYRQAVSKVANIQEYKPVDTKESDAPAKKPRKKRAAAPSVVAPRGNKTVLKKAASRFRRK